MSAHRPFRRNHILNEKHSMPFIEHKKYKSNKRNDGLWNNLWNFYDIQLTCQNVGKIFPRNLNAINNFSCKIFYKQKSEFMVSIKSYKT
jgi:hypothetical protein